MKRIRLSGSKFYKEEIQCSRCSRYIIRSRHALTPIYYRDANGDPVCEECRRAPVKCPRCEDAGRVPDLEEPEASEDGKMPCPTCEGGG